jgi:4'-phosphopantetheinyl transferase
VDERHRAGRFRFDLDRNRFIARRGLLRVILGRYLDVKPASIRFGYGPNGKPFLEDACNRDELTFNLSHSEELAIYAISRKRRIGVDVERLRPIPESDKIVADLYSSTACRTDQPAQAFLDWWTRHEAYLKACGNGLSRCADSTKKSMFERRVSRSSTTKSASEETVEWSCQTFRPAPGHTATVVVEGTDWHLACLEWSNEGEKRSHGFQSSLQAVTV